MDKRGLEMKFVLLLLLALLLIMFVILWYSGLKSQITNALDKFMGLL